MAMNYCHYTSLLIVTYSVILLAKYVMSESFPIETRKVEQNGNHDASDHSSLIVTSEDVSVAGVPARNVGFIHAFAASISVIIVSELGDKTFFIAAILAMRHSRLTVFCGAMVALATMTVLSVFMGLTTTIIPRKYTYYISTFLFLIFGLKMLKEGYYMSKEEGSEEYKDAEDEVHKKEEEYSKKSSTSDIESGLKHESTWAFVSRIFFQSFTMTFMAEWGDRSQLTTIILAAREDILGVTLGGTLGHCICTGIAVIGGRFISQRISVRTVTLFGGVVFIIFALSAFLFNNPDNEAASIPIST